MSASQLPLLIGLLLALAVVLVLIMRQLRSGAALPSPVQSPANPASTPIPPASPSMKASKKPAKTASPQVGAVASWGYQLQDLNLDNAAASPFDILVIDTTLDGSDETTLQPADLARLQRKPDGSRRLVLAYLSIGEAESYRPYWDKQWKRTKPAWLLGENPDWKENYAVCFWDPGWQAIMCGSPTARLDLVLAAGFDGVYLDKCDVFDDLKHRYKAQAATRRDMEGDMVQFISSLSAYAKARNPAFMVVMQNAEDLLDRADLRAHLDGAAKEELVYGADKVEKLNNPNDLQASREMLDLMRAESKPVLVVEYLNDPSKIAHATEVITSLGYVLCISPKDRNLDTLNYTVPTS